LNKINEKYDKIENNLKNKIKVKKFDQN